MQVSAVLFVFFVLLNIAFFVLSIFYFNDKRAGATLTGATITDAQILNTRLAFAVFSGSVTLAGIALMFAPKLVSHALAAAAGVGSLVAAVFAFQKGMPMVLPVTLLIVGGLFPLLAWRSLELSRAAWSVLVAMCFVFALVLLFGAPKVRTNVGIGLWTALIMPGLLTVAAIGLTMQRAAYRDRG